MIRIYKNKNTIPQTKALIDMNDYFFNTTTVEHLDERAASIIARIDNAKQISKYKIVSSLNNEVIGIDKLSSGCKTALNILYFPEKVFDVLECGENALEVIYGYESGNIFCRYPMLPFSIGKVKAVDADDEKEFYDYCDLKEWWEHV